MNIYDEFERRGSQADISGHSLRAGEAERLLDSGFCQRAILTKGLLAILRLFGTKKNTAPGVSSRPGRLQARNVG